MVIIVQHKLTSKVLVAFLRSKLATLIASLSMQNDSLGNTQKPVNRRSVTDSIHI